MNILKATALSAFMLASSNAASYVERWTFIGRGEVEGSLVSYSIDDTWPKFKGPTRSSHWQLVFDRPRADGTKEYRFIDQVDCDRELRSALVIERYDDAGHLLRRKNVASAERRWSTIADASLEARVDSLVCLNGPDQ